MNLRDREKNETDNRSDEKGVLARPVVVELVDRISDEIGARDESHDGAELPKTSNERGKSRASKRRD